MQEKLYAYISVGGRHQNTGLNTTDARSPQWDDVLTFEHPSLDYTEISVAMFAKHTLLPDTLVGQAGMGVVWHKFVLITSFGGNLCDFKHSLNRTLCLLPCRVPFEPYHARRAG